MLSKEKLQILYGSGFSMMDIAKKENCSERKIGYWMKKYDIARRSWSEATYVKRNPDGDPFKIKELITKEDLKLFHTGIALYLGEGDKNNKGAVRLANTNPKILKAFLLFLRNICGAKESKIKAELNIFDDVDLKRALEFWIESVGIQRLQITTIMVRKSNQAGTYKNKSEYGTLSIFVSNTKLKKLVNRWCEELLDSIILPG